MIVRFSGGWAILIIYFYSAPILASDNGPPRCASTSAAAKARSRRTLPQAGCLEPFHFIFDRSNRPRRAPHPPRNRSAFHSAKGQFFREPFWLKSVGAQGFSFFLAEMSTRGSFSFLEDEQNAESALHTAA